MTQATRPDLQIAVNSVRQIIEILKGKGVEEGDFYECFTTAECHLTAASVLKQPGDEKAKLDALRAAYTEIEICRRFIRYHFQSKPDKLPLMAPRKPIKVSNAYSYIVKTRELILDGIDAEIEELS